MYYFSGIVSNRWLGFRLELIGALIVFCAALFAVLGREMDTSTGGLTGLSVSYAMQVTGALNMMIRTATELETNIVSIERILEYSNSQTEAEWNIPESAPPNTWPSDGVVQFDNYSVRQ